jgi:hypothetical protein
MAAICTRERFDSVIEKRIGSLKSHQYKFAANLRLFQALPKR